jgi:hypothetical protein
MTAALRTSRRVAKDRAADDVGVFMMQSAALRTPRRLADSSVVFWAAAFLLFFNLLDALFTLGAIKAGAAQEANPLMAWPLAAGVGWFMLVKIGAVSLGVLLLWRARRSLLAAGGLLALCAVYAAVIAYHLSEIGSWAGRFI